MLAVHSTGHLYNGVPASLRHALAKKIAPSAPGG